MLAMTLGAYLAQLKARLADERGVVEPLSLLIYVLVAVILIVLIFALLDRLD